MPEFTDDDKEKLEKVHTDMYYGINQDNPSVTTRLDRNERSIEQVLSVLARLAWVVVGTLGTVAGEIVMRLLHKI